MKKSKNEINIFEPMKRFIAGLLALSLSVALLAGCGKKNGDTATEENATGEVVEATATPEPTEKPFIQTVQPTPTMVASTPEEQKLQDACNYIYGTAGVSVDFKKAMSALTPLANSGDSSAMYYIGYLYENGYGVEKSSESAIQWYSSAAEAGNGSAMMHMGLMYEYGDGVGQDYAAALQWYKASAAAGCSAATTNIGWMYQNGKGVEEDDAMAFSWYLTGAQSGVATAMRFVGWMYYYGKGVEQSNEQAKYWLQQAADLGDTSGTYLLDSLYSANTENGD